MNYMVNINAWFWWWDLWKRVWLPSPDDDHRVLNERLNIVTYRLSRIEEELYR